MSPDEVREIIDATEDEELDEDVLTEMFRAVYHRKPGQQDWNDGVFSLICAGMEAE